MLNSLETLVTSFSDLGNRFDSEGFHLYAVGGSVRDLLTADGESPEVSPDHDLTTDAPPDAIESILSEWADTLWLQGKRFGTVGGRRGDRAVEITTHRREEYDADSRKPVVKYSAEGATGPLRLEDDLRRRDFTVNAMAVSVSGANAGELFDFHDGLADLRAKRLRTPLSAEEAFIDDPLRMVRAARFLATKGLVPVEELVEAATQNHSRLAIVAQERVGVEFAKILVAVDATAGLRFLATTGLLTKIVPAVADLTAKDRESSFSLVGSMSSAIPVRIAALLMGLPASEARQSLAALKAATIDVDDAAKLYAAAQSLIGDDCPTTPATVRRWLIAHGKFRSGATKLALGWSTMAGTESSVDRVMSFSDQCSKLAVAENLDDISVPLSGDDVMNHLGISPGPEVGTAIGALLEIRIEQGPISREQAFAALDRWAAGK